MQVIEMLVCSGNPIILAMMPETISFHLEAISALRPVKELERKLFLAVSVH